MIYTGNYVNCKTGKLVSVSGDRGKDANFDGLFYAALAPKYNFWKVWHDNIGKINEQENNNYYIESYYKEVLAKLDPLKVQKDLEGKVLLCYENSEEFCHRHLVAYWLELFLDEKTFEISTDSNYKAIILKRPEYLKDMLEEVIKKNYNMKGFNCINATYTFEEAQHLDEFATKELEKSPYLTETIGEMFTDASALRIEADEIEIAYNKRKSLIKNK